MQTTIYKLLGMVVEGKAPKKIKYDEQEWEYNPINDYEGIQYGGCLLNQVTLDRLNDKAEIIEENKIPEKLNENKYIGTDLSVETDMFNKINEIIDYLKSKGE